MSLTNWTRVSHYPHDAYCYNFDADWLLWNGYPGWYGTGTTSIGYFVDGYAASNDANRSRPTGVSQYGAGSNPFHHADYIRGETNYTIL